LKGESQTEQILEHLQQFKSITPQDALKKFGCMRLASRIHELREDGFTITKKMEEKNGRSFARYFLL